eukprot:CAMPEP_0173179206 /NCGR_PEP_ID=MMETSP1141-20130122/5980_1 /TAXON_ID=483371 /ORGANISM="non described non described, Strain CCMP2298" /LENGTH=197 /DNA_ID=CAMNT_0014101817 /DNA_START=159 /DNA_END=751 /DNA_ORIENTATION=-
MQAVDLEAVAVVQTLQLQLRLGTLVVQLLLQQLYLLALLAHQHVQVLDLSTQWCLVQYGRRNAASPVPCEVCHVPPAGTAPTLVVRTDLGVLSIRISSGIPNLTGQYPLFGSTDLGVLSVPCEVCQVPPAGTAPTLVRTDLGVLSIRISSGIPNLTGQYPLFGSTDLGVLSVPCEVCQVPPAGTAPTLVRTDLGVLS